MRLAPWPARLFVTALVVSVAVCGVQSIEAWPLTGWRLFSVEREPVTDGWRATSVDAGGREAPIDFARFGSTHGHFSHTMQGFAALPRGEQAALCRDWAQIVRDHGGDVAGGLRLYATTRDMRRHIGRRAPVASRPTLMWTCAAGRGVRAAHPRARAAAGRSVRAAHPRAHAGAAGR